MGHGWAVSLTAVRADENRGVVGKETPLMGREGRQMVSVAAPYKYTRWKQL